MRQGELPPTPAMSLPAMAIAGNCDRKMAESPSPTACCYVFSYLPERAESPACSFQAAFELALRAEHNTAHSIHGAKMDVVEHKE